MIGKNQGILAGAFVGGACERRVGAGGAWGQRGRACRFEYDQGNVCMCL